MHLIEVRIWTSASLAVKLPSGEPESSSERQKPVGFMHKTVLLKPQNCKKSLNLKLAFHRDS